jgi:hypothetical protein
MKALVLMNRKPLYVRFGALAVIVTAALFGATTNGCEQGAEGDRCNPDLITMNPSPMYNEDECGSGLSCQQPNFCPENYCCPVAGPSANPNCQDGCNGGAASGCAAGVVADCIFLDGGADASLFFDAATD